MGKRNQHVEDISMRNKRKESSNVLEQVFVEDGRRRESGQAIGHEVPAAGHGFRVFIAPRLVANLTVDLVAQLFPHDAFVNNVISQRQFTFPLRLIPIERAGFGPVGETQNQLENGQRIGRVRLGILGK
jgi:hypothetical protein